MIPVVLQQGICDASKDFGDYIVNFEFIKAPTCTYANSTGWLVMGLLVYGAIALSIYVRTNSLIIPTVLTFLLGGAILGQVAGIASPVVVILLITVPPGLLALAYYFYSR